jgi:RNA polymerase sigma factor (TIGR02999 family)
MDREALDAELIKLLDRLSHGDESAYDALAGHVSRYLRDMAGRRLAREFGAGLAGMTIQPTVLADDTFMRLIRQRQRFDNAGHFFAIASREMRRVLIDYCRKRKAAKRGGGGVAISFNPELHTPREEESADLESFEEALERLAKLDARKADVVRYRTYWGLSIAETSEALGVGHATIERDWKFARAWLATELTGDDG